MRANFIQQRRQATGKEKVFHQFVARRKQIGEYRNFLRDTIHVRKRERNARTSRYCDQVNRGIG